jgi:hypothetical protein
MKRKFHLTKILFATLMAANCPSFAAPHTSGAYAEVNIGTLYQSVNFFGYSFEAFGSAGINGNLGYQLSQYISAETGYTNYGRGLNNIDAVAKFIFPFQIGNQDFSVFAKVGPAYVFRQGEGSVLPYGGLGGSYALSNNLDVTVQGQGITNGFFSVALLSLGLTYHFS